MTNTTYVGSLDDGDWLSYANIDFGEGVSVFQAHVAANSEQAGQRLEIHIDSVGGPLLGSLAVKDTGGWEQFATQSTPVGRVTGKHSVYLVPRRGTGICNLEWFTFLP